MWMTLEERNKRFSDRPDPIPLEYAGKWIAITRDRREIFAAADDALEVRRLVEESGREDLGMMYVPASARIGDLRMQDT